MSSKTEQRRIVLRDCPPSHPIVTFSTSLIRLAVNLYRRTPDRIIPKVRRVKKYGALLLVKESREGVQLRSMVPMTYVIWQMTR
jgi:hypothetical protein